MTDEKHIRLTRRRALGGLAAVGIASAGAGLGTSAYFSDQESFDDNTIIAGEFGLTVEQKITAIDQDGIGPDEDEFDKKAVETKRGVGWVTETIEITDAKPGDKYEFCWHITVEENPGYVALAATSEDKNGKEAGNIKLEDLWDIDDESELTTLGEALDVTITLEKGETEIDYSEYYDTLADLLSDLEDGVLLDEDGTAVDFQPGKKWDLCIELEIPTDIGNELQGAVLEWDLAFYAEQQRHNDADDIVSGAVDSLAESDG